MRIRQVKPEFWRDAKLAELTLEIRALYIGLWMVADDAGWFRWNVAEIGVDLLPYVDRTAREQQIYDALRSLGDAKRVIWYECGHGHLPNLAKHQRLASPEKRVQTVWKEHQVCDDPRKPAGNSGDAPTIHDAPTRNGTVRNGKERIGRGGTGGIEYEYEDGRLRRSDGSHTG